jgi:GTPase SAR1 family protein
MRKEDRTYGEDNQERSRRVLEILLRYCDTGIEKEKIKCSKKDLRVTFEISRADLTNLVKEKYTTSNWESDIAPVVSHYLKWLGILQDNRTVTKGSRTWKFSLNLWCDDLEGNLKQFQNEWTKKAPDRSKQKQADSLSSSVKSRSPEQKNKINWRSACKAQLKRQKQQITSSPLHRKARDLDSVHVPLGLVERKERPKIDRTQEISPERGSAAGQQEYTEKRVEHDAFLAEIGKRQPGEHLVILGEPGAGKTTLLTKVWEWLLDHEQPGEDIIVAWVPLAAVKNNELEEYLHKSWIKQFCKSGEIDRYWASFEALAEAGRVWLLLDGADEMGGEALRKLEVTLWEAWTRSTRAIITCRLNLWDASSTNQLQTSPNFQVYRTLDFKYVNPAGQDEVKSFIDNWFQSTKEPEAGKKLRAALDEVGKERIKDLAQNPLRLTLLCATWDTDRALPETQAGLYELFVDYVYDWKAKEFSEAVKLRRELDRALGNLAKQGINKPSLRFRFTEAELRKWVPVLEQRQALMDLGWLNCVGEENNRPEFAFFHPTFQEYFAACSIDDWDYFLPRAHFDRPIPCLGEEKIGPTYRVFESEWRQPIMLWFGRGDVADEDKEKFIEQLITFQDGVGDFYYYRAYCMAAIGVGEFRSSRQAEAIVREIVKWSFGYFNIESQKWIRSSPAISFIALEIISFTHCEYRENYINDILESSELDNEYRIEVAEALGGIDIGNKTAISVLVFLLKMETELSDYQRFRAAESLGRIDIGNKEAIIYLAALLKELNEFESGYGLEPEIFTFAVARALSKIDVGNEEAFSTLLSFLRSPDIGWLLFDVVDTLSEIGVESTEVIATLLSLLKNPDLDDSLRLGVANALSEIAVGNNDVITDLLSLLKNPDLDDSLRLGVANALGEIAVGNNDAATDLLSLLIGLWTFLDLLHLKFTYSLTTGE